MFDGTNLKLEPWQRVLLDAAQIVRERWHQRSYGKLGGPRCLIGAMSEAAGMASLTPDERRQAHQYLTWLDAFWGGDERRWFQTSWCAPGRAPGSWIGGVCPAAHCLVSPKHYGAPGRKEPALHALGFAGHEATAHWNNDSETTFEMVTRRVRATIRALEAAGCNSHRFWTVASAYTWTRSILMPAG